MLASSKTMDALKIIGLNKYERNLWVALLSKGTSTAGELSEISKVPRSRCYDVLESLADKGFVVIQTGKPIKYVVVKPKEALERAKNKIREDSEEMIDKMDRMKSSDATEELSELYDKNVDISRPENATGTIKGRGKIFQQLETMLRNANKNVNFLITEPAIVDILERHGSLLKKANASGVDVRILMPVTSKTKDVAKELSSYAKIKDVSSMSVPGRLFLVDNQEFMLGLVNEDVHHTQDMAFWTQSSHVAENMMSPFFENLWKEAKSYK